VSTLGETVPHCWPTVHPPRRPDPGSLGVTPNQPAKPPSQLALHPITTPHPTPGLTHPGSMGVTPGSAAKYCCSRLAPRALSQVKVVEPPGGEGGGEEGSG